MKLQTLRERLVALAEYAEEFYAVLAVDLPQDDEGFPIPDGSNTSDAVLALDNIASVLTRICLRINIEGVQP